MEVFASAPQQRGFTFTAINYFDSVSADGSVAASREITIGKLGPNVNVNLNVAVSAKVDVVLPYLNYVFASREFGGQLAWHVFDHRKQQLIVGWNADACVRAVCRYAARHVRSVGVRVWRSLSSRQPALE
jgi:hypothetical protein